MISCKFFIVTLLAPGNSKLVWYRHLWNNIENVATIITRSHPPRTTNMSTTNPCKTKQHAYALRPSDIMWRHITGSTFNQAMVYYLSTKPLPEPTLNCCPLTIKWNLRLTMQDSQGLVFQDLMTSSNENILRVTGPLCGEFTGHRWILLTRASDVFFDLRQNKWLSKQSRNSWFETS